MVSASAPSPLDRAALLAVGLALLGFGWSLGLDTDSTIVTDASRSAAGRRSRGRSASASRSPVPRLASGFIMGASSYALLAVIGGLLGLMLLPIVLRVRGLTYRRTIRTGVPFPMFRAIHVMCALLIRTHPCERADPKGSSRPFPARPWIATRPSPLP